VAEEGVYDIQLASFKNLRLAKKEIATLRRKGFEASYAQRGSWYQVYVTGYRTVEDAQEAKKKLAKSYKDCYIRKAK
jgi:cell division protein FtsN